MLLAIDTSGPFCSAAIFDSETKAIVLERSDEIGRGHAEHLMPMLGEMLGETGLGWTDFSAIACTNGPGSFTGLRVGLAAARGLALALGCPCHAVTVFEALAHHYRVDSSLAVLLDARREQVWMQLFDEDGEAKTQPDAVALDDLVARLPLGPLCVVGSGAPLLRTKTSELQRFSFLGDDVSPPIATVAEVAAVREQPAFRPSPLYIRLPDAKPQGVS